ncbi:hypothetical protein PACTADRAFT_50932 [Pachysolen tannophilus NRRL Y-2460]|uniref:Thiaminase-2/PQQC domain-containing protein n=1 Tax=Pachysolen tannophilus NRRL Y-2460 TaxID=669874 RepID=A0A1E4TQL4_PACTA|nr:hypothetical protein PACTADRAFT_50932 [Pachysolen tannophilus NRRL Y-2460]
MELVYLKWAEDAENHNNTLELLEYKHKEWIDLHRGKAFEIWVEFLKKEVDRHPEESDKIFESVRITLNFELEFFDETYQVGST